MTTIAIKLKYQKQEAAQLFIKEKESTILQIFVLEADDFGDMTRRQEKQNSSSNIQLLIAVYYSWKLSLLKAS